jgi:hypothetical protein
MGTGASCLAYATGLAAGATVTWSRCLPGKPCCGPTTLNAICPWPTCAGPSPEWPRDRFRGSSRGRACGRSNGAGARRGGRRRRDGDDAWGKTLRRGGRGGASVRDQRQHEHDLHAMCLHHVRSPLSGTSAAAPHGFLPLGRHEQPRIHATTPTSRVATSDTARSSPSQTRATTQQILPAELAPRRA